MSSGYRTALVLAGWAAVLVMVRAGPAEAQPGPESDPAPVVAPAAPLETTREAALEERIRQLEATVQRIAAERAGSSGGRPLPGGNVPATGAPASAGGPGRNSTDAGPTSNTVPRGAGPGGDSPSATPSASGGTLAPGQSSPPNPAPSSRFAMPPTTINAPLTGRFGPGFELKTADDEFVIQAHDLTQIDGRFYGQGGQNPVHDTFTIPQQWWLISGRITKPYEYFLSFQNVFDTINMLDVFLNVHYDDRLQFKFGRFKTPFTYEFYTEPRQGLISSELSLFANNFALARSIGFMSWGRLFNRTAPLDYAVGIFNNSRNSYLDASDGKDVVAYLNWRPFATFTDTPLENFVLGGSVLAGTQINSPLPATLRTVVPILGNSIVGVPFLSWNANTRESGPRAFWDLHAAWYYKHLSLISEWQSGFQDYALATSLAAHNRVGVDSFYVQAGYFVTGETVAGRGVVKPLRDFDVRRGKRGPGAIELTGRFNALDMTKNVFSAGLADPNLWTNNLYMTDLGFNWYPTQYTKVVFDWNHDVFGQPVQYNASARQKTADLFLVRFQLYF